MRKIFLFFILLSALGSKAQYNPYLEKKKKNRPAAVMARETKKDLKKQKRRARKQLKRSKKHVNRKR